MNVFFEFFHKIKYRMILRIYRNQSEVRKGKHEDKNRRNNNNGHICRDTDFFYMQ